jgi:hypothetical protein
MSDKLDLKLDNGIKSRGTRSAMIYVLLVVVIIVSAANLALFLFGRNEGAAVKGDLPKGKLRELALKLERRDLSEAAARIWSDYLRTESPHPEERAKIWYRIGKLYQESGDYDRAIEAYYRSESSAELPGLEAELTRRTTECFERLGMFTALDDELKARTSPAGTEGEKEVLAEIGDWRLTRSEVKRLMEEEVEAALGGAAPGLTPDQLHSEKERMLESASSPERLRRWLENYLAEELIYRRAMELKLYQNKRFVDLTRRMERELLVQTFLEREYASGISITEDRLKEYYRKNQDRFTAEDGEKKPFDKVRQEVYAMVRREEEGRIQAELMEDLMNRYDVVIHNSRLGAEE